MLVPICSPPAVWGRYHLGCRWLRRSHRCPHTWPQTCAGISLSGDPHFQSPVKNQSKIIIHSPTTYNLSEMVKHENVTVLNYTSKPQTKTCSH